MQTDWLIDFMTLAQTRSFSRAARIRQVTQPAFSRRIQALETWAAVTLVNRSCHPPALTPAGEQLFQQAPDLVQAVLHTRAMLRAQTPGRDNEVLVFAVLPALAARFFPAWLTRLQGTGMNISSRLHTLDMVEGLAKLAEGGSDFLLTYQCAGARPEFSTLRYDHLRVGSERLVPYSKPDAFGKAMHPLPGVTERPLQYLACATTTWLGQVVEQSLSRRCPWPHLKRACLREEPQLSTNCSAAPHLQGKCHLQG